jgi:hypothetical protein
LPKTHLIRRFYTKFPLNEYHGSGNVEVVSKTMRMWGFSGDGFDLKVVPGGRGLDRVNKVSITMEPDSEQTTHPWRIFRKEISLIGF